MKRLLILLLLALVPAVVSAQEPSETGFISSPFDVYVTTQDFLSFRIGPGTAFTRTAVIPAAMTLPAVGRSPNGEWIQVEYAGARGWVIARLLVWSGNVSSLPVSTMEEQTRIVRTGAIGFVPAGTPLYDRFFQYIQDAPTDQEVEMIGRMGTGVYIWLQVDYLGVPYWVQSWEIDYDREYVNTIDVAYLYPYTRLARGLTSDINRVGSRLFTIEDIWNRLANGGSVSCGVNLNPVRRQTNDVDLRQEPVFAPVVVALDEAILDVNEAILSLADACARPEQDFYLTQQEVISALTTLAEARRSLLLADSLAASLFRRDPIIVNSQGR